MNKFKFISFCFLVLALLFVFTSCERKDEITSWDAIDENSLLILELTNEKDSISKLVFPFQRLTSGVLVALQKKSKSDIDLVFSFRPRPTELDSIINNKSQSANKGKLISRSYDGYKIYEFSKGLGQPKVSFTIIEDLVVLSKSTFLVENSIRIYRSKTKINYKLRNNELFQFALLKNDFGNLFINVSELSKNFNVFPESFKSIPFFNNWNNRSVMDITRSKDFLIMNGFSPASDSSLAFFQDQKPQSLTITRFIPSYANAFIHFGISQINDTINEIDVSKKKKSFESEIAIINQENNEDLVACIGLKSHSLNEMKIITDEYSEVYADNQIRSINQQVLQSYYHTFLPKAEFRFGVEIENHLLIAQSLSDLKLLIDAIYNEETWGKTLNFNSFYERCLQESNVSYFVKNPKFIQEESNFVTEYKALLTDIGVLNPRWVALQFSALDNHFYSSLVLEFNQQNNIKTDVSKQVESKLTNSDFSPLKAFVVNYLDKHAAFVQEVDKSISLVSPTEGVYWRLPLNEEIISDVIQIDYYKNGKLQFLFCTKSQVHLIDRLGRYVSGFPKSINGNIQYLSLVDYDKSKNYRYLITLDNNRVHLFDKDINNLSEWGPKNLPALPVASPEHFRAGGKDYFITLLKNGSVKIFSRKGDEVNTFQLPGGFNPIGDFFLDASMNLNSCSIYMVDREGMVLQYTLDGKQKSTYNLVKGNKSVFMLKRTINSQRFYFIRVDSDKIAVFGSDGKIIFERQNSGSMHYDVQILEKSATKVVFNFYDTEQKIAYLFDQTGNDIFSPSESEVMSGFGPSRTKTPLYFYTFPQRSISAKIIE